MSEAGAIGGGGRPLQLGAALIAALRGAGPPLLFGLRVWASVCLALYVAFWLELDNAFWAGTSAAIVCQPQLGASLRKGWFLMIGTVVGALAIVILTACFPQERAAFLIGLALWGAACTLVATVLRNFASYAAALAGYTAAIIASDQLGATGGVNGDAFMLGITRVSEIWIGIVCAGIVLAGTDFGGARRRLAAAFAAASAEIVNGFNYTLALAGSTSSDTQQPVRRELVRKVIALDPLVDTAIGESSTLRYHSPVLQAALHGLLAALAAWRNVAVRLPRLPNATARQDADAVLRNIPPQLRSIPAQGEPSTWLVHPERMRGLCGAAVRRLIAMPAATPSLRLLIDQTARVLSGLAHALDALSLLAGKAAPPPSRRRSRLYVPDWMPAFVNAARTFAVIAAVELFWIVSAWPNGAFAITFAAIVVILLAPMADLANVAVRFVVGIGLAAVGAATVAFAGLPNVETFVGFSIMIGLYLIPAGALLATPWQAGMANAMVVNFLPVLQPANQMSYDTVQLYNTALAILVGATVGAMSFRLLPPISPAIRTRRLLTLTLRDLRRVAAAPARRQLEDWEGRIYSRIAALPEAAEPLQRAQVLTALSVGREIINFRRIAPQLGSAAELDSALAPLAQGDSATATARLAALDRALASIADADPRAPLALRARALVLGICDALEQHRAYFDTGAPT
jgi:uncharacterized membrane protein YccC